MRNTKLNVFNGKISNARYSKSYEKYVQIQEFNRIFGLVGKIDSVNDKITYTLKEKKLSFPSIKINLDKLENMLSQYLTNTSSNLHIFGLFCDYINIFLNEKRKNIIIEKYRQKEIEDQYKELEKYMCCVHVWGDTTSCGGDITNANLKCECGRFVCLNCERKKWYLEANCRFCNKSLLEQFYHLRTLINT